VVVCTRVRYARNLQGFAFPHRASRRELEEVASLVAQACAEPNLGLGSAGPLTAGLAGHYLAYRLISPDFPWSSPGRALYLDRRQSVSLMVNEEDHLRLQALTAGWSSQDALRSAQEVLSSLARQLAFARSARAGFLTASPYNEGPARRISVLLHLVGLATTRRLPDVLHALAARNLTARGLFGEASRALGAFVQVSTTSQEEAPFVGACQYLIAEEEGARQSVGSDQIRRAAESALEFATVSRRLSIEEALRVLSWARWASTRRISGFPASHRQVDLWVAELQAMTAGSESEVARNRAAALRFWFGR
jgi:protein arginine kinase